MFSQELLKQQALNRLWVNQDFQQHLLPLLKQENKWLNPQEFNNDAEFQRAYNVIWAKARAFDEIISLLAGSEQRIRDIQKRMEKDEATTT